MIKFTINLILHDFNMMLISFSPGISSPTSYKRRFLWYLHYINRLLWCKADYVLDKGYNSPSCLKAPDLIRRLYSRRKKQNRACDILPNPLTDRQAVHPRHIDVKKYQIRTARRFANRFFSAHSGHHIISIGKITLHHPQSAMSASSRSSPLMY